MTNVVRLPGSWGLLLGGTVTALLALGVTLLLPTSEPDLLSVMVGDVEDAESGELPLAMRTSNAEELQSYYRQSTQIDFIDQSVGNFTSHGFRLVGGGTASIGSAQTTLTLYESSHGKTVGRRFREGAIDVPESSEQAGSRRIFTVDGVTVGIMRLDGGVLCALASKMPRDLFLQHLEPHHLPHGRVQGPGVGPLL